MVSLGYLIVCGAAAYQTGFSEEGTSVSCRWLGAAEGVKCLSGWKCRRTGCDACRVGGGGGLRPWCAEAEAFCTRASGVCLASLKALTPPPPTAICIFIHLQGQLRCSSPHSTIALPLLNIYGSQETRSQHQLFYSHTFFFFFLIASAPAFTTLSFMASWGGGGISETSSKFFPADQTRGGPCGFTGKATVPSCGHGW